MIQKKKVMIANIKKDCLKFKKLKQKIAKNKRSYHQRQKLMYQNSFSKGFSLDDGRSSPSQFNNNSSSPHDPNQLPPINSPNNNSSDDPLVNEMDE